MAEDVPALKAMKPEGKEHPVDRIIHDGDTVALEGFTHLIPFDAGHEVIRQGRRDSQDARTRPRPGFGFQPAILRGSVVATPRVSGSVLFRVRGNS